MIDRKTRIDRISNRLRRLVDMERRRQTAWHNAVLIASQMDMMQSLRKRPWCSSIRYLLKLDRWVDFLLREAGF